MSAYIKRKIEDRCGGAAEIVIREMAAQCLTKKDACEKLGISKNSLLKLNEEFGINWPDTNPQRYAKKRELDAKKTRYAVEYQGEVMPLFLAAKKSGVAYEVLLARYKKGERGRRLFRRVRKYACSGGYYDLDISQNEWKMIAEFAREVGAKVAATKFQLPMGAITIALSGDFERLG